MSAVPPDPAFASFCAIVAPLTERFAAAGLRLYLVGGVVRDVLLGRHDEHPDLDLTTDAPPDRIRSLIDGIADAVWLQGEKFGTIGARLGGINLEITTHRAEAYVSDSRKPVVTFSTRLEDDLVRRDFTVNAMAVDAADGTLYDPLGGRADLEARVLRTPLAPEESFSDDPLRTLRAARFLTAYALTPVPGLVDAARSVAERLDIVSAERIRVELWRLLALPDPTAGLAFLDEAGLLPLLLPEVAALPGDERSGVLRRTASVDPVPEVRLAALLLGLTEPVLGDRLRALRLVAAAAGIGQGATSDWSDEEVRRLAAASGGHLAAALPLAAAGGFPTEALTVRLDDLRAAGELDDLGPALGGAEVIDLLGLEPGPDVGLAVAWLGDLRLREGHLDEAEVRRRLVEWWESR